MRLFLNIFSFLLLLFNGSGALFGGWALMSEPDGSIFGLSTALLEHSPFRDYFIPGIILFTVNGLFIVFILLLLFFNPALFPVLLRLQGILLTGWIIVQIIMIRTPSILQLIFIATGLLMILLSRLYGKIRS